MDYEQWLKYLLVTGFKGLGFVTPWPSVRMYDFAARSS